MAFEDRTFQGTERDIFELCLKVIENLNWEIANFNHTTGTIKAETNISLLSWGENIEIKIKQVEDGLNIQMNSESHSQIIDWGNNAQNITKFFSSLERLM